LPKFNVTYQTIIRTTMSIIFIEILCSGYLRYFWFLKYCLSIERICQRTVACSHLDRTPLIDCPIRFESATSFYSFDQLGSRKVTSVFKVERARFQTSVCVDALAWADRDFSLN